MKNLEVNVTDIINRIDELCIMQKISVNQMLKNCGLTKSVIDNMKKGSIPSADKIAKIASYFEVSTDYLLGNDTESKTLDEQLKGIDFALHSESKELTDGEKRDVIRFMKFMKAKRNEE